MNEDQIIDAIKSLKGTIRAIDYSKIIGKLQEFGLQTKTEKPKDDIPIQLLREKLEAFQTGGGNAAQMLAALKKGKITL